MSRSIPRSTSLKSSSESSSTGALSASQSLYENMTDCDGQSSPPDDERFTMIRQAGDVGDAKLILVQNWFEELKARVPN